MKKTICAALALFLFLLCLTACGKEELHHHTHHHDAPLTTEQADNFQSAVFRVYARQADRSYTPLTQQAVDMHEGALCTNWEELLLAGPDGTQVSFFPVTGSLGEYYVDGILWDFDTMEATPCTWRFSMATGKPEIIGCYESGNMSKELDWTAYDQTDYKCFSWKPVWDEAGPLYPMEKWEKTEMVRASEDDLSNGVDLQFAVMEENVEYYYNFEVLLTDGTAFCTELMPLVPVDHEAH